jgi:hypothetical protein
MVYAAVRAADHAGLALDWPLAARLGAEFTAATVVAAGCAVAALRAAPGFAPLARFDTLRAWHLRAQRRLFGSLS